MNPKTILALLAALGLGAAAGHLLKSAPQQADAASETPPAERSVRAPAEDVGERASVRALRRRVRELEARLAQQGAATGGTAVTNAVTEARPEGDWVRRGMERMERMKVEDPERYAEITNRMARFRQDRLERAQRRLDFFAAIDTSRMSAADKVTHDRLQAAIARREEIESRLHQEGLSVEDREDLMQEMHASERQLRQLNGRERDNLIRQTAESLGFQGNDATLLVETINDIIRNTDNFHAGHGPGGRRGPEGRGDRRR